MKDGPLRRSQRRGNRLTKQMRFAKREFKKLKKKKKKKKQQRKKSISKKNTNKQKEEKEGQKDAYDTRLSRSRPR